MPTGNTQNVEKNMSQNLATGYMIEETVTDDTDADDFCFVIGPDGDLKSIMIPEHLMDDPPESVQMILKMYGIDNIHQIDGRTIH